MTNNAYFFIHLNLLMFAASMSYRNLYNLFLIPIAMRSLSMGCYMLSAVLSQKAPSIHSKVHPLLVKVTSKYYFFVRNIALAEVLMGIFLIPACFLYVYPVLFPLSLDFEHNLICFVFCVFNNL